MGSKFCHFETLCTLKKSLNKNQNNFSFFSEMLPLCKKTERNPKPFVKSYFI